MNDQNLKNVVSHLNCEILLQKQTAAGCCRTDGRTGRVTGSLLSHEDITIDMAYCGCARSSWWLVKPRLILCLTRWKHDYTDTWETVQRSAPPPNSIFIHPACQNIFHLLGSFPACTHAATLTTHKAGQVYVCIQTYLHLFVRACISLCLCLFVRGHACNPGQSCLRQFHVTRLKTSTCWVCSKAPVTRKTTQPDTHSVSQNTLLETHQQNKT